VPRQYDLGRLRYPLSFAAIAAGIAILVLVALTDIGESDHSKAAPVSTIAPLVKGRPEECPPDWRFVDNTELRFTVCLPRNLLAFDGRRTIPFEQLLDLERSALFHNFVVVNPTWLFPPADDGTLPDVVAPISLNIDVIPPQTGFSGCNPGTQPPNPNGVVFCVDRLADGIDGPSVSPDGALTRYRVLMPTLKGKGVNDAFSLYLTTESLTSYWPAQQPLFRLIVDNLKPY
jgi:hypothetical protein